MYQTTIGELRKQGPRDRQQSRQSGCKPPPLAGERITDATLVGAGTGLPEAIATLSRRQVPVGKTFKTCGGSVHLVHPVWAREAEVTHGPIGIVRSSENSGADRNSSDPNFACLSSENYIKKVSENFITNKFYKPKPKSK